MVGSSDEDDLMTGVTEAEQIAADRKKRLMKMKSRMHGVEMMETDYIEETQQQKKENPDKLPTFRSYEPDIFIKEKPEIERKLDIVDEQIQDQLADTKDTSVIQEISVNTLAPRKLDWDLKRDEKERLEKLERQTRRAINQLIKQRLATGESDLATAVNSAMTAGLQEED
ncbi:hypothetical protein L596_025598 [Steinernema carpocapsae]|uniref:Cwf18 pre-mRNA splicing factor n=1 Tax=Steinernema carpocapsae TaxID=34508 RepID=A0A4U5M876_STECR|nr:hypothetical protein L596_025598 [Steinernema carpocapsae]